MAPTEARLTAEGLWRLTDEHGRRTLQPEALAAELYSAGWLSAVSVEDATERVVLHVLQLEESGFLSTYAVGPEEWLALHRPLPALSLPAEPTSWAGRPTSPGFAGFDSTALEREREEARARARARANEIEHTNAASWARWQASQRPPQRSTQIPLEMLAPPIGCQDHPHGTTTEECGPCGTAAAQRREWFARERYERQLADEEFWRQQSGGSGDDEPF
jgi:hypothetical protein